MTALETGLLAAVTGWNSLKFTGCSDFLRLLYSGNQDFSDFFLQVLENEQHLRHCGAMATFSSSFSSYCLNHQLPETGTSPVGLVCACCKFLIYTRPDTGKPVAYWESQPGAYTLDRQPVFVYVRQINGIQIRSLREEPAIQTHSH